MSENRYAPDSDQDPGTPDVVDANVNPYQNRSEVPGPVESAGNPERYDSQSDRLREAEVDREARTASAGADTDRMMGEEDRGLHDERRGGGASVVDGSDTRGDVVDDRRGEAVREDHVGDDRLGDGRDDRDIQTPVRHDQDGDADRTADYGIERGESDPAADANPEFL
ncbi:hypothetical protein ACTQ49_13185 [Luteococcus sp. Sow4_B9]|uniref:hypothetical protein n=1 Tax=Luteococcus sp. Sow4_B9 TaxID=3438792 RepID=UPI003F9ACC6F